MRHLTSSSVKAVAVNNDDATRQHLRTRVTRLLPIGLILLAACASDQVNGPPIEAVLSTSAKPAPAFDSKANWFFYGTLSDLSTVTLLRGDGLGLDGVTAADPSGYQGGRCGVRATISWYKTPTGDAFFAPAGGTVDPLCPDGRRVIAVIDGNAQALRWTSTVTQIMQLDINHTRIQDLMFGPSNTLPCARVAFSVVVGSGVAVTRTLGNTQGTAGEWTIESTGNHLAGCYVFAQGNKLVWNGATYYLPFRARVVEIR